MTTNDAILLGLIGSPIKHSAAPAMHEAAAAECGLRCVYKLIDVAGAEAGDLRLMLEGVRRLGFSGVNVTYPYKEAVAPLLDALSPDAAAIGAVNTVVVRDGQLIGHNTDATGFARAHGEVFAGLPGRGLDRPIVILGAGGVGKAIAFALAGMGAKALRIIDSDGDKAAGLVCQLAGEVDAQAYGSAREAMIGADGLVNGTPVGMLPSRESPVPFDCLRADAWVADAVYSPLWTPLLMAAKERGAAVMTGRELAIGQALDAFKLFTGRDASRPAMIAAFDGVMAARVVLQNTA